MLHSPKQHGAIVDRSDAVVRPVIGTLLAGAAILKIALPEHALPLGDDPLGWRSAQLFAAELELVLGGWVLTMGFRPRSVKAVLAGCFLLFATVAAYRLAAGYASCGCFGRVAVNPFYTLAADGCALFALVVNHPFHPKHRAARAWLSLQNAAALAVIALIAVPIYHHFAHSGSPGAIEVVEPEKWIGKRLPLLPFIDVGDQLKRGDWIIVLHRHDCDQCRALLAAYERSHPREAGSDHHAACRVAFVELPPYGDMPVVTNSTAVAGRLSATKQWLATAPTTILLRDGTVTMGSNRLRETLWVRTL